MKHTKIILLTLFSLLIFTSMVYSQSKLLLLLHKTQTAATTYAGGSKGDGVTDDFLALQNHINANGDLDLSDAAGKTFLLSQPLYPKSNSTWDLTSTTRFLMQGGDSSMLIADYQKDMNYCVVAEPELFDVGQWVGIVDDEFDEGDYLRAMGDDYDALERLKKIDDDRTPFETESLFSAGDLLRFGFTDSIIAIGHDTLYFAHTLNYADTAKVSLNARVGHVQTAIIADSIENWTLNGGIIDANGFSTNQIMVHPVCTYPNNNEQVAAGTGISIMGSKNIILNNVNVVNGITHNVVISSWQNAGNIKSEDIRLNNITLNKARMKNLWVKECDTLFVNVAYCDSAIEEDGIMMYANVRMATIDSAFVTHFDRNGIATNGAGTGGVMDSIIITNSTIDSSFDDIWSVGMALKGTRQYVDNVTILRNNLLISNQYGTPTKTNNINVSNTTISNCPAKGNYTTAPMGVLDIKGNVGRVNFTNFVLNNNNGRAILIDSAVFYPPSSLIYNGFPDSIYFTGGGIYNHTGYNFEFLPDALRDSTLIVFSDFFSTPSIYGLTATGRGDRNRTGIVDLAWSDSTASSAYVVYRGLTTNPTDSVATTTNKTYSDSNLTTGIYHYRIRGRDASYNYTAYSSNASDTVYEFEVARFLLACPTELHDTVKYKINSLVKRRKDNLSIDSLGQQYDLLYVVTSDSVSSKMNLVRTTNGTGVRFGTISFTAFEGWTGNATDGYINTNYNPSTSTVVSRNNLAIGLYSRTNSGIAGLDCGGLNSGGSGIRCRLKYTIDNYYVNINSASGSGTYTGTTAGYFCFDRSLGTGVEYYTNGSLLGTATVASNGDPVDYNIYLSACNSNGTAVSFTNRQYGIFTVRKTFTAPQTATETTDFEWYMDSNGKGVQ